MTLAAAPRTRLIPPPPPEFAEQFAIGGWERIELVYGGRTDLHRKWVAMTGAKPRHPKAVKPRGQKG